jgi:hypothetical protein
MLKVVGIVEAVGVDVSSNTLSLSDLYPYTLVPSVFAVSSRWGRLLKLIVAFCGVKNTNKIHHHI